MACSVERGNPSGLCSLYSMYRARASSIIFVLGSFDIAASSSSALMISGVTSIGFSMSK